MKVRYPYRIYLRLILISWLPLLVMLVSKVSLAQLLPSASPTSDLQRQLENSSDRGLIKEIREQADLLLESGQRAEQSGNFEVAIADWLQALEIYEQIEDFEGLELTYDYLGQTYAQLGRYSLAEDALRRRLGIARYKKDLLGQIYGLNNLGTVLLQTGNLQAAEETFREGLIIARQLGSKEGEGLSLSNLGLVAARRGNYFEAIKHYQQALKLRRSSGKANTQNNLGDAYLAVERPSDALNAYRIGLFLATDNNNDVPNHFRALRGMVSSHSALKQYSPALKRLNQHLTLAANQENRYEQLRGLRLGAQVYQGAGNLALAKNLYEQAIALARVLGEAREEAFLRNDLAQIIYQRGSN
ncbi:MAG: tetratricopeptide repeat protein [Coleofasciculaceae cyanobacterium]